MTTKAKNNKPSGKKDEAAPKRPHSEAYESALAEYAAALEMMRRGEFGEAAKRFEGIASQNPDELALAERARTYAGACRRRLQGPAPAPANADERYHHGVAAANGGRLDEVIALFDRALAERPAEPTFLYARAATRALQGNAEAAAADLKAAIQGDPSLRFQAGNDTDFEKVRDEAVFIDVIEPTHAGA